ncbi:hypothetical protein AB0B10_06930 [Micromonospora arborensis]|uniref:hypothetical protein n=1 Tax=Micromonospora arborensis TaxID=2116518 RepID=UPI0033FC6A18
MTDQNPRRTPKPGRARKRAIRAEAARTGVAYSVAARQLETVGLQPGETISSHGRTIYPIGFDSYRQRLIERRERRSFDERVADTRRAAILPDGRAHHLVERFPPTRGPEGTGVGLLYHGESRRELLAMLFVIVADESPGLVPELGDLAWVAEMGEETALDMACAELDREARALLEREPAALWSAIEKALALSEHSGEWQIRQEAIRLAARFRTMMTLREGYEGEPYVEGLPLAGVRQILDAVLIVADDGHSPGTRVRMLTEPHTGRTATITGALWGPSGPPVGYVVWLDDPRTVLSAGTDELVVLADQESLTR